MAVQATANLLTTVTVPVVAAPTIVIATRTTKTAHNAATTAPRPATNATPATARRSATPAPPLTTHTQIKATGLLATGSLIYYLTTQ